MKNQLTTLQSRRVRNPGRGFTTNGFYKDFQNRTGLNRAKLNEERRLEITDPDGTVVAVGGLPKRRCIEYTETLGRAIADRFAAGENLLDFLGTEGFPLWFTYVRWRRIYPEFKKMMQESRIDRAEVYASQLEHVAELVDAGNSKAAKVRSDILKHLAAVSDPDTFGHRTKVVGDKNAPIAFTVVTGVPDPEGVEDGSSGITTIPVTGRTIPEPTDPAVHGEGSPGSADPGPAGSPVDPDPLPVVLDGVGGDRCAGAEAEKGSE